MKQIKITILLPGSGQNPVGGFKVVYEYANGLVRRGHDVTVVHSPYRLIDESRTWRLIRGFLIYLVRKIGMFGGYLPHEWFQIDNQVNMIWIPSLSEKNIPDADFVVATAWETAEWVNSYQPEKGKKIYLIQGLETVFENVDHDRVVRTWRLPLDKIVISRWLQEYGQKLDVECEYIPNGLDFSIFGIDTQIEHRNPKSVVMLCHKEKLKGTADGISALEEVKQRFPDLACVCFGVIPRPEILPDWIVYRQKPTQVQLRAIYNQAAIFISPSHIEGLGLPPAEAAQCGAALCLTDIGGHREFAIHNETALLSPPKLSSDLAINIIHLIEQPEYRIQLARQANQAIQRFRWEESIAAFERFLLNRVGSSK